MDDQDLAVLLRRAHDLLLRGWCRRALARTGLGVPCHPLDPKAASWSLHGALMRAAYVTCMDHVFAQARERLRATVWDRYRLCYMWCDDNASFGARDALAVVEAELELCTRTTPY